ncbi:MAG: hypothetical protein MHMPM18_002935 [Marteilia pararefringens]
MNQETLQKQQLSQITPPGVDKTFVAVDDDNGSRCEQLFANCMEILKGLETFVNLQDQWHKELDLELQKVLNVSNVDFWKEYENFVAKWRNELKQLEKVFGSDSVEGREKLISIFWQQLETVSGQVTQLKKYVKFESQDSSNEQLMLKDLIEKIEFEQNNGERNELS